MPVLSLPDNWCGRVGPKKIACILGYSCYNNLVRSVRGNFTEPRPFGSPARRMAGKAQGRSCAGSSPPCEGPRSAGTQSRGWVIR
jgi:hypothetical protein